MIEIQRGTIILTTTHVSDRDLDGDIGFRVQGYIKGLGIRVQGRGILLRPWRTSNGNDNGE